MSSTSQNHQNFVNQPMGNRSAQAVTGNRLQQQGYGKAKQLYGNYLTNTRPGFNAMLGANANVNQGNANRAYNAYHSFNNNV